MTVELGDPFFAVLAVLPADRGGEADLGALEVVLVSSSSEEPPPARARSSASRSAILVVIDYCTGALGFVLEYCDAAEVYATLKCACSVEVRSFRKVLGDVSRNVEKEKEI